MDHFEFQDKFEFLGVHVLGVRPTYALAPQIIHDLGEFHGQATHADLRNHERRQLIPRRVASEPRTIVARRDRAHVKRGAGAAIRVIVKREVIREGYYLLEANTKGLRAVHVVQAIMRVLRVIRGKVQNPEFWIQDRRSYALSPQVLVDTFQVKRVTVLKQERAIRDQIRWDLNPADLRAQPLVSALGLLT